ncbi:50S ribosomal protein L9 [Brevibacterium sp. 50QC2O2]|jgi:large subunit ribosomal protein L9|uniref:50S ribosomal protein L9 n=1 Tax=Brevibacterium TaxID=1696 RepID=UPI00211CFDE5|nr:MULTISPECIES: 50S ribosomal protein L9 [unclassified Brevibacterium]MCQ9368702.1 50S ribosomal protein L9 [Brevibacterium sp. 91QC2O2]MCQ9386950.1 50S ribosomal protein L9 [Brevibacterium sp. 68QC2CO]MCQ9389942.1 50S ribosomal protein L9 [Brevibacterium sp. 50QC2O2]
MATKKIILNQEVDGLGAAGDVVEVKAGYARNLLLPRGWAQPWTAGAEKQIAALQKARQTKQLADRDAALELKAQLEKTAARIEMKAGKNGRLFGAVTPALVAEALAAATGREFDRRQVALPAHVKTPGTYTATVRVHDEITASAKFAVIGKA